MVAKVFSAFLIGFYLVVRTFRMICHKNIVKNVILEVSDLKKHLS